MRFEVVSCVTKNNDEGHINGLHANLIMDFVDQ